MKKLPISRTVFREIIEGNFCYVDKSEYIYKLYESGIKYYFMTRPRRFGKSLFLDTLRAAFSGEKELFKGLFLEKNWDWTKSYPVLKISLASIGASNKKELDIRLHEIINENCRIYNIKPTTKSVEGRFGDLLKQLYEKTGKKVVVLIDEYDKPILDNLTKAHIEEIREELSGFYSTLKDADQYLEFVFITGVSKFSRTSIFSKLNNLVDISLSPEYGTICGYRQEDLETVFADYMQGINREEMKRWYNGYNFLAEKVYNPFDVLLFLKDKKYRSYWFETGTPTFLLELLKKRHYYMPDLEKIQLTLSQMAEFDVKYIELEVLLFQAGYLTIKKAEENEFDEIFEMQIPNLEVKRGLSDYLLRMFYAQGSPVSERTEFRRSIYYAIKDQKPEQLEKAFHHFFSGIPHDWYRKNKIAEFEGFYTSLFYAVFASIGFDIIAEDVTNKGRIDLSILTTEAVFIFEFKMKDRAKDAMKQIKERRYYEKYQSQSKAIYLVGIEFDEEIKNISKFEVEKLSINNS